MMTEEEEKRLRHENDYLRGLVANSDMDCAYCKLPRARMNECQLGFPGCDRADDMSCAPEESNK